MFKSVAASMFGDDVLTDVLDDDQKAQYGKALAAVKSEIARESAGGKAVTFQRKQQIAEEIFSNQVRISDWGSDTVTLGDLVNPEDRLNAYVPLSVIDKNPQRYGRAYADILTYLRHLPGNGGWTDQQLRKAYGPRIEKAIGRRFSRGVTRAEIEAALKGQ